MQHYTIEGANNSGNRQSVNDKLQGNYENFYLGLENFKQQLIAQVEHNRSKSYYKFSDGEYFWLKNNQIGSVAPGKRDSFLKNRDLTPFKEGVVKNDYHMSQMLEEHFIWFREIFNKEPDFLVDYVYGLVANKWFTSTFNGKLGLIGAKEKMDLIKDLCKHDAYKDYLKFDGFNDYISVKQRGLCDSLEEAEEQLKDQLSKSSCSIFLVGIGHAQQALLHKLKEYKPAIYISVGSGIDAYAGVQDNLRPYMFDWINFRIKDYDYNKVDIWRDRLLNVKLI